MLSTSPHPTKGTDPQNPLPPPPKVLEKTYYMLDGRDAVLERSEGTKIDWKPGKNVRGGVTGL
jgi:hypothetical protein